MKRSHICPKCGGRDILRVPGKSGAYGAGNNIQMGFTYFSAVLVHHLFFRRAGPPVCLLRLRLFGRMDRRCRPGTPERKIRLNAAGGNMTTSHLKTVLPGPVQCWIEIV